MRYKIGQPVKHPEWGFGEVIDRDGDEKICVKFPTGGAKKLSTRIELEIIGAPIPLIVEDGRQIDKEEWPSST